MQSTELQVVTGAFGYTGRYIAQRLLDRGATVKTLTGHPDRPNPFGDRVSVAPFSFDNPSALTRSLEGAETLFNTYWIRFPRGEVTFEKAVQNTLTLLRAAEDAGVSRIVHVSITNAAAGSALPYFKGKAAVEEAVKGARMSHAIIRPTLIFGREDILVNNIAWFLRRFPVFAIPGSGEYRVQPVFVEDVAGIAVEAAGQREDVTIDAVGPETFTFEEMVRLIAEKVGARAMTVHVAPRLVFLLSWLTGRLVRDVVLTRAEIDGLMAELLVSDGPPTGATRLSEWLEQNADEVGRSYASEIRRHYR
ncbi:MAG: NAD(P)H-binding protein [Chloroflexi bacterium]|nr:NAD(P)H-binding protein [Chloroflexota bacterium]